MLHVKKTNLELRLRETSVGAVTKLWRYEKLKSFSQKKTINILPIMSIIQSIIILTLLVPFVSGRFYSTWKHHVAQTAISGLYGYTDMILPTTCPVLHPHHFVWVEEQRCDIMKTYARLVEADLIGGVTKETMIDIVYTSWGEDTSFEYKNANDSKRCVQFIVLVIIFIASYSNIRS